MFALVLAAARPALAQLSVQVRDTAGAPIANAQVELWRATARAAVRQTDANGRAQFAAAEVADASAGLVRRIGFAPARFALPTADSTVLVRLEALAQSIPALTIAAVRGSCPQSDEPDARTLWSAAAARYQSPSIEGRSARFQQRQSTVDERDVGAFEDRAMVDGSRGYTELGMRGATSQLERGRYVVAIPSGSHQFDLLGGWRYPAIEAELAGVFALDAFRTQHSLAVVAREASRVVLRFCARDRRAAGLDGTIRLSERGDFLDARWRFWNPASDAESAGGEVTFAPASTDGLPEPLVATSGLFWRQLPSKQFVQRWQQFSEWRFTPRSSP